MSETTALAQRRRVLLTMLTTLSFHYPPGRVPPVIAGIRQYLGGLAGSRPDHRRHGSV
jgi:hypothetical protein